MSLDADHDRPMLVAVTAPTVNPDGAEGGCESTQAEVVATTEAFAERLPAASTASTPSVYDVPQASPEKLALVDPVEPALEPFRYSP